MVDFATHQEQFTDPGHFRNFFPAFNVDDLVRSSGASPHETLSPRESWKASSYSDFVVNWVTAEATSPRLGHLYQDLSENVRAKIEGHPKQQAENFTVNEVDEMEMALHRARGSLFQFYNLKSTLSFRKVRTTVSALQQFDVMKPYVGNWPSFGSWAACELLTGTFGLLQDVKNMMKLAALGVAPTGCPVAILPAEGPAILIEGYKRSLLAIQRGAQTIEVMLCLPDSAQIT